MRSPQALAWLPDARGLTLQRPWADAITGCGKRVENRSWPAPESVDTILIHAGKAVDSSAGATFARLGFPFPANPVQSAVVALAQIAHVCKATVWGNSCECGPWAVPGQYHWRLADELHVLATPVPARGAQGLWRPTREVLDAVAEVITNG